MLGVEGAKTMRLLTWSVVLASTAAMVGEVSWAGARRNSGGAAGAAACACVGDLNNDGEVDGADLGLLLGAWDTGNDAADLDDNGLVDGADLGLLLGGWGSCTSGALNDNCGNAQIIEEGDYDFCTLSATSAGPDACTDGFQLASINQDIWYTYIAPDDGTMTASTCGQADFDTKMAVYGSTLGGICACPGGISFATLLACDDDTAGCPDNTTEITLEVTAGNCYRIRVGGYGTAAGLGTLSVSFAPSGEYCNSCISISGQDDDVMLEGTTAENKISFVDSSCGLNDDLDEWYCYEVSCSGSVLIDTLGSDLDTVLTVFKGTCDIQPPPLVELGCNDDYDFNEDGNIDPPVERSSQIFVDASDINFGDTLYIRVAGYNKTVGAYKLRIQCTNCCGGHSSTSCFPSACGNCICEIDEFCCTVMWDGSCAGKADSGVCDDVCPCDD